MADAGTTAWPWRAKVRPMVRGMERELALLAIVLLVLAGFGAAAPQYLSLSNLLNIGQQTAVIACVCYGMTAVIICKGVDISAGSTLAASSVIAALALAIGLPGWLGIVLVIALGAASGLLGGVLVIYPYITTLVSTL